MHEPRGYPILNFTQNLANAPGRSSVPALLRHVADTIERLGDVDIQDIAFHPEDFPDDDGEPWPTLTVYFHEKDEDERE
jgi:hypothetical protein